MFFIIQEIHIEGKKREETNIISKVQAIILGTDMNFYSRERG